MTTLVGSFMARRPEHHRVTVLDSDTDIALYQFEHEWYGAAERYAAGDMERECLVHDCPIFGGSTVGI
jgi:hypothetical protein